MNEVPSVAQEKKSLNEGFSLSFPSLPIEIIGINIQPVFSSRVICDNKSLTLASMGLRKSSYISSLPFLLRSLKDKPSIVILGASIPASLAYLFALILAEMLIQAI